MKLKIGATKSKGCIFNKLGKCSLGGDIPEDCRLCTSCTVDELDSGDLVKITSKTSRHRGTIAVYLGFCNGRRGKEYIKVKVSDKKTINLKRNSVERYWE